MTVEQLVQAYLASKEHALHPLFPMLVTADHAIEELRKDVSECMNYSTRIHFSLGLPTDQLGPQDAFKVARIVRTSLEQQRDLATDRELLTQLCGTLRSLNVSLEDVRLQFQRFVAEVESPNSSADQTRLLGSSNATFEGTIDYLISTSRDMLNRAQQIEMRLQWLFPMV